MNANLESLAIDFCKVSRPDVETLLEDLIILLEQVQEQAIKEAKVEKKG
jgi:hypothetical protein